MKHTFILIISLLLLACLTFSTPNSPNEKENGIAIKAGKIFTVSGNTIENGTILVSGEKILEVGLSDSISIPQDYTVYEYPGSTVYPGIINAMTNLGISGISAIDTTNDYREAGQFNPHISAYTAFYPWSNLIPNARDFGVLTAVTAPSGGLISGKALVANLLGWVPEDMFIKNELALVMNIPEPPSNPRWARFQSSNPADQKEKLEHFISCAYSYYLNSINNPSFPTPNDFDIKYEAMKPTWKDRLPVIISAENEESIKYAIQLGKKFKLNVILKGAYDGEKVLKEIKESGCPVILSSMYGSNSKWEDGVDKIFRLPAALAREGIPFAFTTAGAAGAFDLPLHAGRAVAYGLSQDEAIKGLTLYPAKILGIDQYGSIEKGKIANLVITDGNILENSTLVQHIFIKGIEVTDKSFFQKEFNRAEQKISGEYR